MIEMTTRPVGSGYGDGSGYGYGDGSGYGYGDGFGDGTITSSKRRRRS